jgi:hypothetical protein
MQQRQKALEIKGLWVFEASKPMAHPPGGGGLSHAERWAAGV